MNPIANVNPVKPQPPLELKLPDSIIAFFNQATKTARGIEVAVAKSDMSIQEAIWLDGARTGSIYTALVLVTVGLVTLMRRK